MNEELEVLNSVLNLHASVYLAGVAILSKVDSKVGDLSEISDSMAFDIASIASDVVQSGIVLSLINELSLRGDTDEEINVIIEDILTKVSDWEGYADYISVVYGEHVDMSEILSTLGGNDGTESN